MKIVTFQNTDHTRTRPKVAFCICYLLLRCRRDFFTDPFFKKWVFLGARLSPFGGGGRKFVGSPERNFTGCLGIWICLPYTGCTRILLGKLSNLDPKSVEKPPDICFFEKTSLFFQTVYRSLSRICDVTLRDL